MKSLLWSIVGPILFVLGSWAIADEPEDTAALIDGEASLIGGVADGTPAPPAPPRPLPEVRVLNSSVRHEGGRTITMNRVAPPELPEPPPPKPLPELTDEEMEALLAQAQENARETRFALVSATVYDHEKTLLRWWIPGDRERNLEPREFQGWSNVDFFHLGGFHSFEYEGIEFLLIMALGGIDTEVWEARLALYGRELDLPESPELPDDGPAYVVTDGSPDDTEGMKVMDGLHALYAKEKVRLAAAYEARERAREEREAFLRANPPKPKDTVIHFWRRPREAQTGQEGGA